jgi:hypothetical protein
VFAGNLVGAIPARNYVIVSHWKDGRPVGLVSLITREGLKELITSILHVVKVSVLLTYQQTVAFWFLYLRFTVWDPVYVV